MMKNWIFKPAGPGPSYPAAWPGSGRARRLRRNVFPSLRNGLDRQTDRQTDRVIPFGLTNSVIFDAGRGDFRFGAGDFRSD